MTPVRTRRPVLPALVAAIVGTVAAAVATLLFGLSEPTPPAGAPVAVADTHSTVVDDVVDLTNEYRVRAGCEPLVVDPRLTMAAESHSRDMAQRDYFRHTTPEGLTFQERIRRTGYVNPGTAENIARGQKDAEQVVAGWMASTGHRANILNCEFARIGVGLHEDGMYWTQDFGY